MSTMTNLKVSTEVVVAAAGNLRTLNNQIRNEFSGVQTAISRLDGGWEGSAATNAISKFNEVKTKYPEERYKVIENYVNFLLQQVGEGYTQTEDVNKSLADAFK